jgi:hypothetical protein
MSVIPDGAVVTIWPPGKLPPWGTFVPYFAGWCDLTLGAIDYRTRKWVDDGRTMTVRSEFSFFDSRGVEWFVPKGSTVDGFSIPVLLWGVVAGTPFTGKGRIASVVHDVACRQKARPWRDVHRAFGEACVAGGMSRSRALLYGSLVSRFGPRWEV